MEISIVILSYKMKNLVKNCIKSILESELDVPYEIIVVDNNSKDGIKEMLDENFPQVKFIQSDKNLGMGGGNNLGIKASQGKYVLISNADIFVFPNSIAKLYDFLKEKPNVGLVAPKLLNPDRTLQHTCYRWHNFWTPIYRRTPLRKLDWAKQELDRFLMKDWDHGTIKEVDWIQGSCILLPRRVFKQVGLFDERFFMYFEDTDLCRRIKQAGLKNVYLPEAEVIHLHRRQSADGKLNIVFNKMTRTHIVSWLKYMRKYQKSNISSRA